MVVPFNLHRTVRQNAGQFTVFAQEETVVADIRYFPFPDPECRPRGKQKGTSVNIELKRQNGAFPQFKELLLAQFDPCLSPGGSKFLTFPNCQ